MDYFTLGLTIAGFVYLFLMLDRLFYKENAERKKALHEMNTKINTLGGDISLLAVKKKKIIHVVVHDAEEIRARRKGKGIHALVPISSEEH